MPSALRTYQKVAQDAVFAYASGNYRKSADSYWKAVRIEPNGKWTENRYHCFSGYTSILREKYFAPTKEDFERLQSIVDDENEPNLFRVEAAFTIGLLNWDIGNRELAATFYREAIGLYDATTTKERNIKIQATKVQLDGRPTVAIRPVGELLDETVHETKKNLAVLENPFGSRIQPVLSDSLNNSSNNPPVQTHVRSDGTTYQTQAKVTEIDPKAVLLLEKYMENNEMKCDACHKTKQELNLENLKKCSKCKLACYCSIDCQKEHWTKGGHKQECCATSLSNRVAVGGTKCDACQKTLEELQMTKLLCCGRCKMAFYCSVDCQKKQWKVGGHKQACRQPNEIKFGDVMKLQGLQSKPELNGRLVSVQSKADSPGRWKVQLVTDSSAAMSIATEKLIHLRPAC